MGAMNILALETSCEQASVALLQADDIRTRTLAAGAANHSESVLDALHALLDEAGLTLARLDAVAFGAGPGAFTGLRLGCSVAQGLAMGAGLGVVAVPSLHALGARAPDGLTVVATDARMGEIYTARYRVESGRPAMLGDFSCISPERFDVPEEGRWHALGSAFARYPELVERARKHGLVVDASALPRAVEVARLAALEVAAGRLIEPEHAAPLYVRDKVALTTAERLAQGGRA